MPRDFQLREGGNPIVIPVYVVLPYKRVHPPPALPKAALGFLSIIHATKALTPIPPSAAAAGSDAEVWWEKKTRERRARVNIIRRRSSVYLPTYVRVLRA